MSETDAEERQLRMDQMRADIANKWADTEYKRGLLKYEPWKLVAVAFTAGAGIMGAFAAVLAILLRH